MASGTVTIQNRLGFHVRPSTRFMELAQQFESRVFVCANGQRVEATSPMGLLTLGAVQGDEITVETEGSDAEEACRALVDLVEDSFGGIE
ncbi:MAG: HPr family phosphocarrier protein [Planctomycetota bacterium]